MDVKPDELRAGIEEAHKLGMKVTGHLCSVGYIEAAEMGIDSLEHGPYGAPDGELYSKKKPGVCLDDFSGLSFAKTLGDCRINSLEQYFQSLIGLLRLRTGSAQRLLTELADKSKIQLSNHWPDAVVCNAV
jgi:imidazolonepropionase-like amidohydrolase